MNEKPILRVKKLDPAAKLPTRSRETDAGYDIYALDNVDMDANKVYKIKTGIALEIPEGYYGHICERSGLASQGFRVGGGIVDESYRGEIAVVLTYHANNDITINNGNLVDSRPYSSIEAGEKIAQIVFKKYGDFDIEETEELSTTDRGSSGFGSSGKF